MQMRIRMQKQDIVVNILCMKNKGKKTLPMKKKNPGKEKVYTKV